MRVKWAACGLFFYLKLFILHIILGLCFFCPKYTFCGFSPSVGIIVISIESISWPTPPSPATPPFSATEMFAGQSITWLSGPICNVNSAPATWLSRGLPPPPRASAPTSVITALILNRGLACSVKPPCPSLI